MWWIAPAVGAAYGSLIGVLEENMDKAVAGAAVGAAGGFLVYGILTAPDIPAAKKPTPAKRWVPGAPTPTGVVQKPGDAPPWQPEPLKFATDDECLKQLVEAGDQIGITGVTTDPKNNKIVFFRIAGPGLQQYVIEELRNCHPDLVEVLDPTTIRAEWKE